MPHGTQRLLPGTESETARASLCSPALTGSRVQTCDFASVTNRFCNGLWTASGGWTRNGPIAGPSGGSYVYLEAESAVTYTLRYTTAYLTSALGQYSRVIFKYHMRGAGETSLAVEAYRHGAWSVVWRQDVSGGATWSTAQAAFFLPVNMVRFVGRTKQRLWSFLMTDDTAVAVGDVVLVDAAGCASSQLLQHVDMLTRVNPSGPEEAP